MDTNIVVSYALKPGSRSGEAYGHVATHHTLLVSAATLAELTRVLTRPKLDRFANSACRQAALDSYASLVAMCAITHTVTDCRDPSDNKFLELALSGRADLILSGDDDLLVLHPWRSVPILSPAAFLAQHT